MFLSATIMGLLSGYCMMAALIMGNAVAPEAAVLQIAAFIDGEPATADTAREPLYASPTPEQQVLLHNWLYENLQRQIPNDEQREQLVQDTGLREQDIHHWFVNARKALRQNAPAKVHPTPHPVDQHPDEQTPLLTSNT